MEEENNPKNGVQQEEIHDLLFNREIGWQEIIHDLINTEQLDPWNINITLLTNKYLIKIQEMEETDFFVSGKVLLAAALLLRIKSEILLNKYVKGIDDILFGREDKKTYELERIELDEEIPELVPRSPIPRFKKVTLQELMESLNKAIITENRRIKKVIIDKNAIREAGISLPKRKFNIKNKIREIYSNLFRHFNENQGSKRISFTDFIGMDKEERIIAFSPLLHLENQKKVWMEQAGHFEEIHIWLHKTYMEHNPDPFGDLKKELEDEIRTEEERIERREENKKLKIESLKQGKKEKRKLEKIDKERLKKIEDEFSNPIGD